MVVALSACGTVQTTYKPAWMGNMADGETDQNIEIQLRPDKYRAKIGDPLTFSVVIRNVGSQPVWFPSHPDLLVMWVYPDGRRDNIISSDQDSGSTEMVLLNPGQDRVEHSVVTTYYFDRIGIHEFRAIVSAEKSTTTAHRGWSGRAVSNGFGVHFMEN